MGGECVGDAGDCKGSAEHHVRGDWGAGCDERRDAGGDGGQRAGGGFRGDEWPGAREWDDADVHGGGNRDGDGEPGRERKLGGGAGRDADVRGYRSRVDTKGSV